MPITMKISLITMLIASSSCLAQTPDYIFESGFESDCQLNQYEVNGNVDTNYADIVGYDNVTGYDWVYDFDIISGIGDFRIYYEDGDTLVSAARIVTDPVAPSNQVLRFAISEPHIEYFAANDPQHLDTLYKGRIQASIKNSVDFTEFHLRHKMYIHPDFDSLKTYPNPINWLTIQEIWNNESFDSLPFRITLNIVKASGTNSELFFGAHGQVKENNVWNSVWDASNSNFSVPLGEWFTMDTYFFEGDSLNGRYKITITDSLNNSNDIFDITDYTFHPDDPTPDGVTSFNAMKLYTSGALIDGMDSLNACLCLYWDDFQIWTDSVLSISQFENLNILRTFPNPVTDILTIETDREIQSISVYSSLGILLDNFEGVFSNEINMKEYSNGVYYIEIKTPNGKFVSKILKE